MVQLSVISYAIASTGVTTVDGFAVKDLDKDGNLDLIAYSYNSQTMYAARGTGSGTFNASVSYAMASDNYVSYSEGDVLQIGDINGDGILDAAVVSAGYSSGAKISVRLGTGSGTFGSVITTNIPGGYTSAAAFTLGDFDGDGKLDAVLTLGPSGYGYFYKGSGNGTFTDSGTFSPTANSAFNIKSGDVNGDGFLDIISFEHNSYGSSGAYVRIGKGNGQFDSPTVISTGSTDGSAIAIGDVNKDGVYDFVTTGSSGDARVFKNTTQNGINPLLEFSLKTKADAKYAQSLFDQKLNQLTTQRGQIGAFESRVNIAVNTATSIREQYMAAGSRIGDADIAQDSAEYVRTQILQNAATAILSQANQSPKIGLTLLQSL